MFSILSIQREGTLEVKPTEEEIEKLKALIEWREKGIREWEWRRLQGMELQGKPYISIH